MTAAATAPREAGPIRVLVVDDQELVRAGFCVILETADGIAVAGEAADGAAAVAQAVALRPDVVLMDVRMPGMDGLEATRLIFARRPAQTTPAPSRLATLTARERDVLLLIARGRSNAEIAVALFVSEATVKTHVGNLLAKLGLRDRVQAVILAYETGLVIPGDPGDTG